jgi:membrane-bound inhibitor of C-type lysozyme
MKWSSAFLGSLRTPASVAVATLATVAIAGLPALAQSPKVISGTAYKCAEGKSFSGRIFDDKTMEATFGSKVLVLKQADAASGTKYTDNSVTVYTKGDEAFVEVGSKKVFVDCVAIGAPVQGMW